MLSGTVPSQLAAWTSLSYLDISFNLLEGGVDDALPRLVGYANSSWSFK